MGTLTFKGSLVLRAWNPKLLAKDGLVRKSLTMQTKVGPITFI